MQLRCGNTAERIEVLLRVETLGDLRNILLDGGPDFPHSFDAASIKLLWPLVNWFDVVAVVGPCVRQT